jgi:murein L,D-transpeptidase YcbB/YkuD
LRFLAESLAVLALATAALAQQSSATKKKAVPAASAKAKAVQHAGATGKTGKAVHHPVASVKTGAAKGSASRSTAYKAGTSKAAAKTGTKSHKTVARRPPTQQQPTTDRYKEIQQALADKGYFQGPADGAWNAGSVEALKRFQKDQNLDPDGKIGALSLIALGLGPKRGEAQAVKSGAEPLPTDPPPIAQPQP